MSEHPLPPTGPLPEHPPAQARLGLVAIFGSTFFELVGYFMLTPLLLLRLKGGGESTALAGVFAASGWLGVFFMTPFASAITQRLGRRPTLWLAALIPVIATAGFAFTPLLWLWFVFKIAAGMASGLRWVLAEAVVAEFSPPGQRGRYVGIFETMVGITFVVGPLMLAWVGADSDAALWIALGFMAIGLVWSLLIPRLPDAADAHSAKVGLSGVWHALLAHPLIMTVGFVGGFFESGLTSILPLYGLALGLGATVAALLVSASGLGSALMMLPAGVLADRMAHHPAQRWGDGHRARLAIMRVCALITLLRSLGHPLRGRHALAGRARGLPLGRRGRLSVHAGDDRHRLARGRHHPGQQHRRAGAVLHPGRGARARAGRRRAAVGAHAGLPGPAAVGRRPGLVAVETDRFGPI
ncbi:MFS transporter [Hydrogenophaga sp. UC242_53]|uniref:MFS transporter n=1 Tax=Hydrogenophaga sp. UC242_53 TaxID=3350170 RepID=UPI0036D23FC9